MADAPSETNTSVIFPRDRLYQSLAAPTQAIPNVPPQGVFAQTDSPVIFRRTLLYQSVAEPTPRNIAPPALPTVGSWYANLATPPNAGFAKIDLGQTDYAPDKSMAWFRSLNEPVRRKPFIHLAPTLFFVGRQNPATSATAWFAPLTEPVRKKQPPTWSEPVVYITPVAPPPPAPPTAFYAWLSEPVRKKPWLRVWTDPLALLLPVPPPPPAPPIVWLTPFAEPVRKKPWLRTWSDPLAYVTPVAPPPAPIPAAFYSQLSEPVRKKPSATQSGYAEYLLPIAPPDPPYLQSWYRDWDTPTPSPQRYQALSQTVALTRDSSAAPGPTFSRNKGYIIT